jgi:hypothetical protein
MKRILSLALALCLAATAHATGKPTPPPTPIPTTPGADVDASAQAAAAAAAKAQAAAQAQSTSSGTGIGVGTGGAATAGGGESQANSEAYGGGGSVASDTRMLVFPAPVWSTVPEARTCIATQSQAWAAGWNLVSRSTSNQASDPACIGVLMARSAYANCHFLSEALITARVYATVFPGAPELPVAPDLRNLTLSECEELKRPRLVPTLTMAPPPVVAPAPVVCPASAPSKPRAVTNRKAPALTCPVPMVRK